MKTFLTLLALGFMVLCAGAQTADAELQRQQQLALQYAKTTGRTPADCLQAVQVWEWCKAHPQGGVVNGVSYNAAATKQQMAMANELLMTRIGGTPGSLADSAARPVGRSSNDPQRIAERMARQGKVQLQVVAQGTLNHWQGFAPGNVYDLGPGRRYQQASGEHTKPTHSARSVGVTVYQGRTGLVMRVDGEALEAEVVRLP